MNMPQNCGVLSHFFQVVLFLAPCQDGPEYEGSGDRFSEACEMQKLYIVILKNPCPFPRSGSRGCPWELVQRLSVTWQWISRTPGPYETPAAICEARRGQKTFKRDGSVAKTTYRSRRGPEMLF